MIEKKITVLGVGYVGLPLIIKASKFYKVVGFDIDKKKIDKLNNGIDETGSFKSSVVKKSAAVFTTRKNQIRNSDIFIICVPTPVQKKK